MPILFISARTSDDDVIIALNDIARTAEEHRPELNVFDDTGGTDFVILDMTDNFE